MSDQLSEAGPAADNMARAHQEGADRAIDRPKSAPKSVSWGPGPVTVIQASASGSLGLEERVTRSLERGPGRVIQASASGVLGLDQEQRDIHLAVEASLMPASKHSVQEDEDLAARNMSIYGNPFGPRKVDPLEMQVSRGAPPHVPPR